MAYELTKIKNNAKILMIDRGAPLEKRICPIKAGKTKTCVKCNPCHIMNGYGGAGTLSDGKYNLTTEFGGDLHRFVGRDEAMMMPDKSGGILRYKVNKAFKIPATTPRATISRTTKNGFQP